MKKTKTFTHTIDYGWGEPSTYNLYLAMSAYSNNDTLAVIVMSVDEEGFEEQFDVITVNLPFGFADGTHAYIDTNNASWAEQLLKEHKFAKPTGEYGHSGWCTYPLYEFDLSKFSE